MGRRTVGDREHGIVIEQIRGLLLGRTRLVMLVAGVLAALLVVGAFLLDEGEVVRLTITDDDGREHETDLWIVDVDGRSYLRAADPDSQWLERLREHPRVSLIREGSKRAYYARPDESLRDLVGHAMSEKYGFSDRVWSAVADRSHSVPIRLELPSEDRPGPQLGDHPAVQLDKSGEIVGND